MDFNLKKERKAERKKKWWPQMDHIFNVINIDAYASEIFATQDILAECTTTCFTTKSPYCADAKNMQRPLCSLRRDSHNRFLPPNVFQMITCPVVWIKLHQKLRACMITSLASTFKNKPVTMTPWCTINTPGTQHKCDRDSNFTLKKWSSEKHMTPQW